MRDETGKFDLSTAPMRIGAVRLKVRDVDTVAAFYRTVLGLSVIDAGTERVTLGHGGKVLLDLVGDANLVPRDPRQAGLFHIAFLLPARADLARWLDHARAIGVAVQGASDHIGSEALYLADPEGNGVEIYADRPMTDWIADDGRIRIASTPLDLPDLMRSAAGGVWTGFPDGGVIGHVHLQVGDTAAADRFYRDLLGFDLSAAAPGASFYASGGYHHQLAANIWNSRGAGQRPRRMAGLDRVEIVLRDVPEISAIVAHAERSGIPLATAHGRTTLRDPWGTEIALRR